MESILISLFCAWEPLWIFKFCLSCLAVLLKSSQWFCKYTDQPSREGAQSAILIVRQPEWYFLAFRWEMCRSTFLAMRIADPIDWLRSSRCASIVANRNKNAFLNAYGYYVWSISVWADVASCSRARCYVGRATQPIFGAPKMIAPSDG